MVRPLFSLIIPCYNTGERFKRILDSLSRQGIEKDDLEIIVVDDNSTDKSYLEYCKDYDFNYVFANTNVNVHCPGNTRREGMKHVSGEWLCFCDHDDYFEDNAFAQVKEYIKNLNHKAYMISTIMNSYNEEKQSYTEKFIHKSAWLHGKFYCVDTFIKPFNINFKKDLVTHEDIYFNSSCIAYLFSLRTDWDVIDINTYRWVEDENSITRKQRNDRGYLNENFNDYIVAASEPFWNLALETKEWVYVNQIMMTLLHAYFYYEAVSYYDGYDKYVDIVHYISEYIHKIMDEFEVGAKDIIDFVYVDPNKYQKVLEDCEIYSGKFIPKTSFRDFVFRLAGRG